MNGIEIPLKDNIMIHQFNSEVQHLGEPAESWYPKGLWERDINN